MSEKLNKCLANCNALFKKEIQINSPFIAPSRSTIGQELLGEERSVAHYLNICSDYIAKYYQEALGWLEANPENKDLKDAVDSVYHFAVKDGTQSNNYVNTYDGHENFLQRVQENNNNPLLLIGPKGSGKTFYLNYFLNTESEELYKTNKLVWFRLDYSTLYDRLTNLIDPRDLDLKNLLTLKNFIDVHIAYISFRYRNGLSVFLKICDENNTEMLDFILDEYNSNAEYSEIVNSPDLLVDKYKKLIKAFASEPDRIRQDWFKMQIDQIDGLISIKKSVKEIQLLSYAIRKYLQLKGYKVVYIIDGIDNIDYYKHYNTYSKMLRQLVLMFLSNVTDKRYKGKCIISLRSETYNHIQGDTSFRPEKVLSRTIFRVHGLDPAEILNKKIPATVKPTAKYFKNKKSSIDTRVKQNFVNIIVDESKGLEINMGERYISNHNSEFEQFSDDFFVQLLKIMANNKKVPQELFYNTPDGQLIYKLFYNHNMRAFLHNFINIFIYKRLFEEKMNAVSTNRSYLITEGMLLNGHLYLDTKEHPYEYGKCIPNIFYFDRLASSNIWHGLCGMRLLQYIKSGSFNFKSILSTLHKLFNYEIDVIKHRLFYFLSHGLLSYEHKINSDEKIYLITEKGKFLLHYIFTDINLFYYLALDTPLGEDIIDGNKYIKIHSNNKKFWEEYIESCILTSISFSRYIIQTDIFELKELKEHDRKIFSLPKEFPEFIIAGCYNRIKKLNNFRNKSRFDEICSSIEDLLYR